MMAIKIYTYANPYEIDRESYWNEIKDCPQFCVSQTMVNGMEVTYPDFAKRMQLTTIRNLLNVLYQDWEEKSTRVRQMMEVDAAIQTVTQMEADASVQTSLAYNTISLVNCIRMFQELGLQSSVFTTEHLNVDQKYLVSIYQQILQRSKTAFRFSHVMDQKTIDDAIEKALDKKRRKNGVELNMDVLRKDAIVIHGIHQFSPAMLCAIEDISRHKTVILLFNYQEQYQAIYKTWLSIYSLFDAKIQSDQDNQFHPMPLMVDSYASNLLADSLGKLADGEYRGTAQQPDIEVIEFANMTEFAGYAAALFETAQKTQQASNPRVPALLFMKEQLYSASGRVNDILRAYFPEQFGERHFLDYPIGHFFVSVTNMWDPETKRAKVDSFADIKECLGCGIISESRSGLHLNSFHKVLPFIEKESTLVGIIAKLKKLRKYNSRPNEETKRIGYMAISKEDLAELIRAMEELNQIILSFFDDFDEGADNFRRFYAKIQGFITKRVADMDELDEEMRDVITRLLVRMSHSDLPDTGTFICLRQTMSYYLSQDENLIKGANWIVRDFEQIDGDILQSRRDLMQQKDVCYHFCCLSDKDICSSKDERLPWPLDIRFFEYACVPLDWKYQIFLKSKMEFRNFKKYALLYGLEFNRVGVKLSYVKTENEKKNDLFHMLSLLGVTPKKYHAVKNHAPAATLVHEMDRLPKMPVFSECDRIKWVQCPYRFALESLVQEKTLYRDRFLIHNYMRYLLVSNVRRELQGERSAGLKQHLEDGYQKIADTFHILTELEKTELIHAAYQEIRKYYLKGASIYPKLSKYQIEEMNLLADFLYKTGMNQIQKNKEIPNPEQLAELLAGQPDFYMIMGEHCKYCASKDVCLKKLEQ